MTATFGVPSCVTCPSYSQGSQVTDHISKNINTPMCSRYGHILSMPRSTDKHNQKIVEIKASSCPSHGEPQVRANLGSLNLQVAFPSLDLDTFESDANKKELCKSCAMCEHFMPDNEVEGKYGWWSGLCTAKGKLILGNRQTFEARACDFRQFGHNRHAGHPMTLMPEFEDGFWTKAAFKDLLAKQAEKADPRVYVTDKEVTPEDTAAGVRAWRKVADPEGTHNFTHLPIFDASFFDDNERAKIPQTGDDEHPESYLDHNGAVYKVSVAWMELDETPAMWGVAGTGKTELLRHLAWLMQLPFERISITGSTELDDLAGKMLFENSETIFKYGRVPLAWTKPSVLCLDEPNVGPPDVWQFIRPLTDNSKQLVLDQNKGERLPRHDFCFMGLAMNPAWDAINVGTQVISDADGSRLLHIFMELPPAEVEREIIRTRVAYDGWEITDDQLNTIMGIAADLRGLVETGSIPISWGIRPQIKVARASRWFDLIQAYRMGAADFLEPSAQEEMLNVVRSHVEDKSAGRRF